MPMRFLSAKIISRDAGKIYTAVRRTAIYYGKAVPL